MAVNTVDVMRRLAYIRYLHSLGVEQTRLPEPMSSAAVLMFHDAVESFLLLAGEYLGAPATYEFEKYWDALPSKLTNGVKLPVQQGMKRLNKQRVALKHHGSHPSRDTVEVIKSDTATFLLEASQLVFGVDYGAVSMSSVIPQEAVRELALKADVAKSDENYVEAMITLVDAWKELFDPWPTTKAFEDSSPLRFGPSIGRTLSGYDIASYLYSEEGSRRHARGNEDIGRQIAAVTEIATALQEAARLTTIGVNYIEYLRFRALTPHRDDFYGGRRTYRAPVGYAPAEEDVTYCTQFIVTAALRLATAENQLAEPPHTGKAQPHTPWETIKEIRD